MSPTPHDTWHKDIIVVALRHMPLIAEGENVVRETQQMLDHELSPLCVHSGLSSACGVARRAKGGISAMITEGKVTKEVSEITQTNAARWAAAGAATPLILRQPATNRRTKAGRTKGVLQHRSTPRYRQRPFRWVQTSRDRPSSRLQANGVGSFRVYHAG